MQLIRLRVAHCSAAAGHNPVREGGRERGREVERSRVRGRERGRERACVCVCVVGGWDHGASSVWDAYLSFLRLSRMTWMLWMLRNEMSQFGYADADS